MRRASFAALGISLAAHVGVAAALLAPKAAPAPAPALPGGDPAPQLAGETFELPAPETVDGLANASPSPDTVATPAPVEVGDAPARPSPPAHAARAAQPSHQGRPSAGKAESSDPEGAPGGTSTGLYGAVGDRSATDLARTFTRAFRQVASADPAWTTAPLGPAGSATVTLTLDESGHIEGIAVSGAPSAPLTSSIQRTMALVKSRPFTANGKTTKLVLEAKITNDSEHRFGLGSDFTSEQGTAHFELAIGRRIDLRVKLR